jgi:hypothetical protein
VCLAGAGLRAAAQRALARLLVVAGAGLAVVAAVLALAWLASWLVLPGLEERDERRWQQALGASAPVHFRFVSRAANPTAVAAEEAAAAFGINLVPMGVSDRGGGGDAAAGGRDRRRADLKRWCDGLVAGSSARGPTLPPGVVAILDEEGQTLDGIIGVLTSDTPPRWELDVEHGGRGRLPKVAEQLWLQRWLVAASVVRLERGELGGALTALEAAWRMNADNLERPELLCRTAGYEAAAMHLAVLRRAVPADETWTRRLTELRPVSELPVCVYMEGRWARRESCTAPDTGSWSLAAVATALSLRPLRRAMVVDASRALRQGVERLSLYELEGFSPGVFSARLHREIPSWNHVAHGALPSPWSAWVAAVILGLDAELTAAVLEAAAEAGSEGALPTGSLPRSEASTVPGWIWERTSEDGRLRFRLRDGQGTTPTRGGPSGAPFEWLGEVGA